MNSERKEYLINTVPILLKDLKKDNTGAFGIMSPQHMLEHLIKITKAICKDYGPPPNELTDGQKKFMSFLKNGAVFEHRPSAKSKNELPPLKYDSISKAKREVPIALDRLYSLDREMKFFNPVMGTVSFEELELFTYKHFKYHLEEQFGLNE